MTKRFRITSPWGKARYEIQMPGIAIPVFDPPAEQQAQKERMAFTWKDGKEYRVSGLIGPNGELRISSGERVLGTGRPIERRLRPIPGQFSTPLCEWQLGDQTIRCEGRLLRDKATPRALALITPGGKRYAFWYLRGRGCEGIVRGDLQDDTLPVILAMVLASRYDFWDGA